MNSDRRHVAPAGAGSALTRRWSTSPAARASDRNDSTGGPRKLAEVIASNIEQDIMARGWPVGTVLGSEAELLDRYTVSRAVLREAVRLLEHHHSATMRRGPGGGLVVSEPVASAVMASAAAYLNFKNVSTAHLLEVRTAVEVAGVGLATARLSGAGIARLRSSLERERHHLSDPRAEHQDVHDRLHLDLADLTGNPVYTLFVSVLMRLTTEGSATAGLSADDEVGVFTAHAALVDAIVARDISLAKHRMTRHLEGHDTGFHR